MTIKSEKKGSVLTFISSRQGGKSSKRGKVLPFRGKSVKANTRKKVSSLQDFKQKKEEEILIILRRKAEQGFLYNGLLEVEKRNGFYRVIRTINVYLEDKYLQDSVREGNRLIPNAVLDFINLHGVTVHGYEED